MNENRTILQLKDLLVQSLFENDFYDKASNEIRHAPLKSAFAKYHWLRGEHIMSIKSFLISHEGKLMLDTVKSYQNDRFWNNFKRCMTTHNHHEALTIGTRYIRFILHKYSQTMDFSTRKDRLGMMLHNHFTEIEEVLCSFGRLNLDRRAF